MRVRLFIANLSATGVSTFMALTGEASRINEIAEATDVFVVRGMIMGNV